MKKKNILIFILAFSLCNTLIFSQSVWHTQQSGTDQWLNSVYFVSPTTGWAVGANGVILKTTNGGLIWNTQSSGTSEYLWSVFFTSPSTGFVVGTDVILKTVNGGVTWSPITPGAPGRLFSVYFSSQNTGWAVGENAFDEVIIKTTNGGINWFSQTADNTSSLFGVHFTSNTTGWAVGGYETSKIIKTTNGGDNWFTQTSPVNEPFWTVYFRPSSNTGWISGGNGTILKTTNGGVNWNAQNSGINNAALYSVNFPSLTTGWAVGQFGVIVKTTDGGNNWISENSGTTDWLNSVFFTSDKTGWAVGGYINSSVILKRVGEFHLNLSAMIEGFYNANKEKMNADTVRVYLRNSAPPYSKIDSSKNYMDSSGNCTLTFYNVENDTPYYIVIKHRNSIETWSDSAINFSSNSLNYDFTTEASQAYGNNMTLKGTKYCIYSGDVLQNGFVDQSDVLNVYSSSATYLSGYIQSDVTGDEIADLSDLSIVYNNSAKFVRVRNPVAGR